MVALEADWSSMQDKEKTDGSMQESVECTNRDVNQISLL